MSSLQALLLVPRMHMAGRGDRGIENESRLANKDLCKSSEESKSKPSSTPREIPSEPTAPFSNNSESISIVTLVTYTRSLQGSFIPCRNPQSHHLVAFRTSLGEFYFSDC